MEQTKTDKIKMKLKMPRSRYEELVLRADKAGISVDSMILIAIDAGINYLNCIDTVIHSRQSAGMRNITR